MGLLGWLLGTKQILKPREIWHYTCINGHTWESKQSPRGTYCFGELGQTRCPVCKTPVCKGDVYIDGKSTTMGAMHIDFIKNKSRRKKK